MFVKQLRSALRHAARLLVYGSVGVFLTLIVVFALYLDDRSDLDVWHLAELDEEFTAHSDVYSFAEYLELEDRLFRQLDEKVYGVTGPAESDLINRYRRDSLSDPDRWPQNWNRSYEFSQEAPQASVLLLHGLSDSPYSLRRLALRLREENVHVLGLRVPGHGTAPSGLVDVTWEDMAAAVRLAMRHLSEQHGDRPVHIVGYSNGAALAVQYTLSALDDPELPPVASLALLSPEIGVTAAAALAIWQARLGGLLGLEKLAWNSILPEYDPYKYGSFAVNAADLSHRLTAEIQRQIDSLQASGKIGAMPPVLAFSSIVDSTVLAPALVSNLLNRLPGGRNELVLFDINDQVGIEPLLAWSPKKMLDALKESSGSGFALRLISNEGTGGPGVVEKRWSANGDPVGETDIGLRWPPGVYSLSHVALPFAPDDPLYGGNPSEPSPGVALGDIAWRGENGVLKISPAAMLRLRWNPFYSYVEKRTLEFLALKQNTASLSSKENQAE